MTSRSDIAEQEKAQRLCCSMAFAVTLGAGGISWSTKTQFDELLEQNEQQPNRDPGCNGPGRFRWTVNPAAGALSLGRLADDCSNRVLVLTRKALTRK